MEIHADSGSTCDSYQSTHSPVYTLQSGGVGNPLCAIWASMMMHERLDRGRRAEQYCRDRLQPASLSLHQTSVNCKRQQTTPSPWPAFYFYFYAALQPLASPIKS